MKLIKTNALVLTAAVAMATGMKQSYRGTDSAEIYETEYLSVTGHLE